MTDLLQSITLLVIGIALIHHSIATARLRRRLLGLEARRRQDNTSVMLTLLAAKVDQRERVK